jgi:glycosyltransferase involved in cell wall biosynthesis
MSIINQPLVSILIGTYNREDLIRRCLDSIFNQSYINIEVIVIDDCSSDKTPKVLSEYKLKYPNQFKFLKNKKNMGIAYNSNKAFELSRGDYIALIGDDDEWHDHEKISKQIKAFENNKKLGIVSTYWNDVKNGEIVKRHKPIVDKSPLCQILKGNGIYCGSTVLISKQAWESVNGFDEKVPRGTDSDLFRSIIVKGYATEILEFFSTNVYIDDHLRMTPKNTLSAKKSTLFSHSYTLYKFKDLYIKHPYSLVMRVYSILLALRSLAKFYIIGDKK